MATRYRRIKLRCVTAEGTGKAYAFYGPLAGSIQAANANAILIGEIAQGLFGVSVSGTGDFNGGGFDDVIVGA